MADERLRKPRKKANARIHELESPFPIPIESITGKAASNSRWYYYFGTVQADHVEVYKMGDITFLYRLGFFGKGILSKSRPQYEKYNSILSEHARRQYNGKKSSWDPEEREFKIEAFTKIQNERLRHRASWNEARKEEISTEKVLSYVTDFPCVCEDFETRVDVDAYESLSTDGEDENTSEDERESVAPRQESHNTINESVLEGLKRPLSSPQGEGSSKLKKLDDCYKLFEHLQLTFEEAFFLSYGLGCLSVKNEQHTMTLTEMWQLFSRNKKNFVQMYVAYHHFRSKGWVVRFGNLYGADFLLYQGGMPFFHASYSVFVSMVAETTLTPVDQSGLSWRDISSICRVNEKVAKEVLFCHVVQPKDLSKEDLQLPSCVKRFSVVEVVSRRWVAEKHREIK